MIVSCYSDRTQTSSHTGLAPCHGTKDEKCFNAHCHSVDFSSLKNKKKPMFQGCSNPLKVEAGDPQRTTGWAFLQAIMVNFLTIGIHGTDIMHTYMNTIIIKSMNHLIKINCSLMCAFFSEPFVPLESTSRAKAKFEKKFL